MKEESGKDLLKRLKRQTQRGDRNRPKLLNQPNLVKRPDLVKQNETALSLKR